MRKIKDNGRTYKIVKYQSCMKCDLWGNQLCWAKGGKANCANDHAQWRETLPSRLSRFIKRMARK